MGGDEALRVEPPQWDRVLIKETARPLAPSPQEDPGEDAICVPGRVLTEHRICWHLDAGLPAPELGGGGAPCFLPSPVCGAGSAGAETREDPSGERIWTVTEVRRRQTYGGKQFARPEHSLF